MPKDREYWQRHEEYQRTGVWPPTQKQIREREAQSRQNKVNDASQRSAAGISPLLSGTQAREILDWHKENPDNASYDNDGNPINHE